MEQVKSSGESSTLHQMHTTVFPVCVQILFFRDLVSILNRDGCVNNSYHLSPYARFGLSFHLYYPYSSN